MQFKKDTLRKIAAGKVSLAFRRFKRPSLKRGDVLATAAGPLAVGKIEKFSLARITENDVKRAGYPTRAALLRELGRQEGDLYRIAFKLKPEPAPPPEPPAAAPAAPRPAAASPAPRPAAVPPAPRPVAASPSDRPSALSQQIVVAPRPARTEPASRQWLAGLASRTPLPAPPPRPQTPQKLTKTEVKSAIAELGRLDKASGHGAWTVTALKLIDKYPARRTPDLAASQRRDIQAFDQEVRKLKELGLTESLEIGYRLSPRGRAVLEMIGD